MNNSKKRLDDLIKQAESIENDLKNNFGSEIESLEISLMPATWQAEYKSLYAKAKRNNPEIWKCNVHNLPEAAYYNNADFFDMCYQIEQVSFLVSCYPEKKEDIKKLFAENHEYITLMYDDLNHFFTHNDFVKEYSELYKNAEKIILMRTNNFVYED